MDFATEPGATTEPDLAGGLGVSSCAPRANPQIDHDSIHALVPQVPPRPREPDPGLVEITGTDPCSQGDATADDIVSETFLAAFRQRGGYDLTRPSASPWLYAIATNLMRKNQRKEVSRYRAFARTGAIPEEDGTRCRRCDPRRSPAMDEMTQVRELWAERAEPGADRLSPARRRLLAEARSAAAPTRGRPRLRRRVAVAAGLAAAATGGVAAVEVAGGHGPDSVTPMPPAVVMTDAAQVLNRAADTAAAEKWTAEVADRSHGASCLPGEERARLVVGPGDQGRPAPVGDGGHPHQQPAGAAVPASRLVPGHGGRPRRARGARRIGAAHRRGDPARYATGGPAGHPGTGRTRLRQHDVPLCRRALGDHGAHREVSRRTSLGTRTLIKIGVVDRLPAGVKLDDHCSSPAPVRRASAIGRRRRAVRRFSGHHLFMTALEQPAILTPSQAREVFRTGEMPATTSGWCRGHVQANLLAVPRDLAFDALLFAIRNPGPCPLLEVTDPGDPHVHDSPPPTCAPTCPPTGCTRTAARRRGPRRHDYWRDDLVALLIGCSFTFEAALATAGVPLRHSSRAATCRCTSRRGRAARPAGSPGRSSSPCARYPPDLVGRPPR